MSTLEARAERIAENAAGILSKRDLADLFGVSIKTISRWVQAGTLPPPCIRMTQRTIRWKYSAIAPLIDGSRRKH